MEPKISEPLESDFKRSAAQEFTSLIVKFLARNGLTKDGSDIFGSINLKTLLQKINAIMIVILLMGTILGGNKTK